MNKLTILILLVTTIFASSCTDNEKYKDVSNTSDDYQLIPKPTSLEILKGRFLVNSNTKITGEANLSNEGQFLAEMLSLSTGENIVFNASKKDGTIVLMIDSSIENKEGYELNVTYNKITIKGKTPRGVFYGIQTLRQLMPPTIELKDSSVKELTIPATHIKDYPKFSYRGMHLDVARHFYDVPFLKKYIDMLSLHKINVFHWHLTEDQGWRIEIKKYPKLTEIGAWRNGTIVGYYPGEKNDDTRYGGFYTQEDVKELVKYALSRHVDIIPEIELPGHAGSAIAAYPHLSCFPNEPSIMPADMGSKKLKELQANGTPKVVYESWGIFDDVFCAGQETTFTFLEDVLTEVAALFPSQYIHIGGDECPKKNWERCPHCQKRMKKEGLKDEHELQSYFIQRIEKFLNSKGKKIIGWDEILEGGLAPNATVMSWQGIKGAVIAAKQHHDVIVAANNIYYLNYYQNAPKSEEPLANRGLTKVEDVYKYNPFPKELTKEERKYVLGGQGNMWTEYIKEPAHLEYMTWPRLSALSEGLWYAKDDKDWENFHKRLNTISDRYDRLNINYAKHYITKK